MMYPQRELPPTASILMRAFLGAQEFVQRLTTLTGNVLLTVFYFTVVLAFGSVVRLFQDRLALRMRLAPSYWVQREPEETTLQRAQQGF